MGRKPTVFLQSSFTWSVYDVTVKQSSRQEWPRRFYADLETSDRAHFLLWPSQLKSSSIFISACNRQWSAETDLSFSFATVSGQPPKCDEPVAVLKFLQIKNSCACSLQDQPVDTCPQLKLMSPRLTIHQSPRTPTRVNLTITLLYRIVHDHLIKKKGGAW